MGVLLRCVGVLAVLWFGPAAGYLHRFRRQDATTPAPAPAPNCVTCAGKECEAADKTSKCEALYTVTADGPEKDLAGKLPAALGGADAVAAAKLTKCYTLKFKAGDKEGELRDCGPEDVCAKLEDKAKQTELAIAVASCVACDSKAAKPCNGKEAAVVVSTTKAAAASETTAAGAATTTAKAGTTEEPTTEMEQGMTTEEEAGTTATTAAPGSSETSGARAFKILSNSVYLMWVTSVVLLFRLE